MLHLCELIMSKLVQRNEMDLFVTRGSVVLLCVLVLLYTSKVQLSVVYDQ